MWAPEYGSFAVSDSFLIKNCVNRLLILGTVTSLRPGGIGAFVVVPRCLCLPARIGCASQCLIFGIGTISRHLLLWSSVVLFAHVGCRCNLPQFWRSFSIKTLQIFVLPFGAFVSLFGLTGTASSACNIFVSSSGFS